MIEEKYNTFSLANVAVFVNHAQGRLASWVKIQCSLIFPEPCSVLQAPFRVTALYRYTFKNIFYPIFLLC